MLVAPSIAPLTAPIATEVPVRWRPA